MNSIALKYVGKDWRNGYKVVRKSPDLDSQYISCNAKVLIGYYNEYNLDKETGRYPDFGPMAVFNRISDARRFIQINRSIENPVILKIRYKKSNTHILYYKDKHIIITSNDSVGVLPAGTNFADIVVPIEEVE